MFTFHKTHGSVSCTVGGCFKLQQCEEEQSQFLHKCSSGMSQLNGTKFTVEVTLCRESHILNLNKISLAISEIRLSKI